MKNIVFFALALVLTVDSILRAIRSNFNLGAFLMYCITAALWAYALFHVQIDAFCSHGIGLFLKWVFWAGCLLTAAIVLFIGVKSSTNPPDGSEKSIVVLGAGLRGTQVSGVLARRLDAAYDYYEKHPEMTIIVTGGQGMQEAIPEAKAMLAYLVDKGVPAEKILMEDKSVSTEENFLFAKPILEQHGISADAPMVFVTNNFHCYRSEQYAKDAGFTNVRAIPASIDLSSVLPCYLREVLAVLYYWVFHR